MRGKGTKLGEGERKVRLSQDRMPVLGERGKGLRGGKGLCTNVVRANVASRKCRFAQMSLNRECMLV